MSATLAVTCMACSREFPAAERVTERGTPVLPLECPACEEGQRIAYAEGGLAEALRELPLREVLEAVQRHCQEQVGPMRLTVREWLLYQVAEGLVAPLMDAARLEGL